MRYAFIVLSFLLYSLPALALPYSGIYFFGDSLTDVGNVQNTYAAVPHPPGAPDVIPGTPYDAQGRFSNGAIYADVLAAGLGFSATPSTAGGNNYAYGGARTRYQATGLPFKGILNQIATFTALPGGADSAALYVVWGGANNLQDLLVGTTVDALGQPIPDLFGTIGDLQSAILQLYDEGARSFLIPNVPNLALTPRVSEFGAEAQAGATQLSLAFNALLGQTLFNLQQMLNDFDVIAFDTYAALNAIVADPSAFGLSNTTDRCYTGDDLGFTGGGSVCADPASYLFWDGIHPTTAVHTILGQQLLAAVVPEPGTLALVSLALFGVVQVRRRRAD
jgi:phospholipase/lecithinase/hemolysin